MNTFQGESQMCNKIPDCGRTSSVSKRLQTDLSGWSAARQSHQHSIASAACTTSASGDLATFWKKYKHSLPQPDPDWAGPGPEPTRLLSQVEVVGSVRVYLGLSGWGLVAGLGRQFKHRDICLLTDCDRK